MALLTMQGASLNLGGKPLLENASFSLEPGERVCLTGRNGAGKSSLLSVLSGQRELDSGIVVKGTLFGQMPQEVPEDWKGTVFSLVAAVLGEEGISLAKAHKVSEAGNASDSSSKETSELVADISTTTWERYGEILAIIKHLGLKADEEFEKLSGGTKRRVALARALLLSSDLILDEPTNHLDVEAIMWLEEYLLRKATSLIFVSHDREFSRRLATRIVEVDRGKLFDYACGYDHYLERREERLEIEERHFALFDKKLAQEEAWIRQGIKARRTRNMGRVRELRELRATRAKRRVREGGVKIIAEEATRSGKLVIDVENASFAWPGKRHILENFSTIIQRGDRIGIIGANGAGKSTLLRLLLGEVTPQQGIIRLGTNLEMSYFDQFRTSLDMTKNVMDSVADGNDVVTVGGKTKHVAGYLQDFLFPADRLRVPVSTLSGGERNRLLLAKLFTKPSNMLVLDEPTNDLDVETLELLEEMLLDYSGTVLLVSHDRRFLDNIVTSVLAFEGKGLVQEYAGGWSDWQNQRMSNVALSAADKKNTFSTPSSEAKRTMSSASEKKQPQPIKKRLSFNEQRERSTLENEHALLPEKLDALEQEQREQEALLADPELFSKDPVLFQKTVDRLAHIEEEQTALLEHWENVEQRLEELTNMTA